MKKLLILSLSWIIVSCTTSGVKESKTPLEMVQPKAVDTHLIEGLTYGDLVTLDKSTYLVELQGKNYKNLESKNKKAALIVVNEKFKQRSLNVPSINLKYWLKKQLNSKSYYVESYLNSKTPTVVLVQFGERSMPNDKVGELKVRYLRLIAVDYQAYKNKKEVVPIWEGQISSVGPSKGVEDMLPILGSFIDRSIGQDVKERILMPATDPILDKTKDVPVSIVIDDLKPSLEEIEFFN